MDTEDEQGSRPGAEGQRPIKAAHALRAALNAGYTRSDLRSDIQAGLTVGIVALPLSMALAIATGVPPQHGLYTAIIGGALIALLGGSTVQVSGPTAAFVVILAPITAKFGLAGLAVATFLAGLLQLLMGLSGFGRFIQYIPYPVTIGFTSGIAVVIATLQLKDFLGLTVASMPEHYIEKVAVLARAMPTLRVEDLCVGALTLAILVLGGRFLKKLPVPLVALLASVGLALLIEALVPGSDIALIRDKFATLDAPNGIPEGLPPIGLPWNFHAPLDPAITWNMGTAKELLLASFAIAMLGAIESLLSAVVADGMTGKTHDPNAELVGQGIGNMAVPFFGGFAATGAIARTATNIRFGARTPVAAITHAAFILLTMLLIAPYLGYLPMAALAALLLRVAWHMAEVRHFAHTLSDAPRSDKAVLLICFGLTVAIDMVVSVTAGVMLAALLFMRRMSDVTSVRLVTDSHGHPKTAVPGLVVYEVAGPLFFGAAQKAMSVLLATRREARVILLDMRSVPVMDITGLVNLESAIERIEKMGVFVVLGGVNSQPLHLMAKRNLKRVRASMKVMGSFDAAMEEAARIASGGTPSGPGAHPCLGAH